MRGIDGRMRWALPWAILVAGIVLRDCVVIAAAGPLALWAFYSGMDNSAPMDAFRAAIRSAIAGVASILAAIVLIIIAMAAVLGLWQPNHEWLNASTGVLAVSLAAFVQLHRGEGANALSAPPWMKAWVALAAGGVLAAVVWVPGWGACTLPVTTATMMALAGWHLLREVASEFVSVGRER